MILYLWSHVFECFFCICRVTAGEFKYNQAFSHPQNETFADVLCSVSCCSVMTHKRNAVMWDAGLWEVLNNSDESVSDLVLWRRVMDSDSSARRLLSHGFSPLSEFWVCTACRHLCWNHCAGLLKQLIYIEFNDLKQVKMLCIIMLISTAICLVSMQI